MMVLRYGRGVVMRVGLVLVTVIAYARVFWVCVAERLWNVPERQRRPLAAGGGHDGAARGDSGDSVSTG